MNIVCKQMAVQKINMIKLVKPSNDKLLVALSFLGIAGVYLWQPIQDLFITHSFNEAMNLVLESEVHAIDDKRKLLVLHVQPFNRGNVAISIKENSHKDAFVLELKKIALPATPSWIDGNKMQLVSKIDFLKNYEGGYVIEANTSYDEVEAIPLEMAFIRLKSH